jgi:hypothetical protein
LFIALGLGVTSAYAGPCGDEIAQLEKAVRQSESNPAVRPTAPQSIGAQLRHQPTPESVRRAEVDSRAGLNGKMHRIRRCFGDSPSVSAPSSAETPPANGKRS